MPKFHTCIVLEVEADTYEAAMKETVMIGDDILAAAEKRNGKDVLVIDDDPDYETNDAGERVLILHNEDYELNPEASMEHAIEEAEKEEND